MQNRSLTLNYNFAKKSSLEGVNGLGPTLNIVRAGTATRINPLGLIEAVAANIPRFDFDLVTKASHGLLVEEARTNLCLQSQNVSTAPWTTLVTPVINPTSAIAPDGTLTLNSINDNNGAGFEGVVQQITIPDDSATYTFSMYIEKTAAGSAPTMGVNIVLIGGTNPGNLPIPRIFTDTGFVQDLQAGTNSRIEDAGDYWRLVSTVANNSTGHTIIEIQIFPATAANGFLPNVAAAVGINKIWGMQMEVGVFATSYIPTTTATVTRNADVVSTTDISWLNASAGTWYLKGQFASASAVTRKILTLDDGGVTDRIFCELDASENINFSTTHSADTNGASDGAAVIAVNTDFQVAASYADDDVIAFVDGASSGADLTAAFPLADAMTTLRIGADSAGNYFNGHIKELRYYNERKNNVFLDELSQGLVSFIAIAPSTKGDGGHAWPSRSNDPRMLEIIDLSGITKSRVFQTDLKAALEIIVNSTGSIDDLWKKYKTLKSITDTSEPFVLKITDATSQPLFANVSLLIDGEGTEGDTDAIDHSSNAHALTYIGGTEVDNARAKFGATSLTMATKATNSRLDLVDDAAFEFETGDFCIEAFVFLTALPSAATANNMVIVGKYEAVPTVKRSWLFWLTPTDEIEFFWSLNGTTDDGNVITTTANLSTGVWTHLAVSRESNVIRIFQDGVLLKESDEGSKNYSNGVHAATVGALNWTAFESRMDGNMDEIRVVKGEAVYTKSFTAPTKAHPLS